MTTLYWIPVGCYLVGWIAESVRYWSVSGERYRWAGILLGVGWGAHTLLFIVLALQQGIDVSLMLNGAAWAALLLYYGAMHRWANRVFPLVFPPFAVAMLITAYFASRTGVPPASELGLTTPIARNLLTAHIIAVLSGTLLFGLACLVSIGYLYQERRLKTKRAALTTSRLPALGALERHNHKAITLGFFFLTVGLLLGLVVAGINTLPHRLFSLRQVIPTLTWLIYAVFLLAHDLQGRRGRFGAVWSIFGFLVVVASLVSELIILSSRGSG